jgi:SAM-dependent methyltransferase
MRAAAPWQDVNYVRAWTQADTLADTLVFPRAITAALVAHDRPQTVLIIDVASGPGDFLGVLLDEFPDAHGVWTDASEAMLGPARARLARFGDRVDYVLADMTALAGQIPTDADAIITSRAAHHLDRDGLAAFYTEAAAHLAPGGWLVNLDHTGPGDVWDKRLRAIRPRFNKGTGEPKHHHNYPLASIQDHLDGYAAAGIADVEIVWKAFYICLFAGRKNS